MENNQSFNSDEIDLFEAVQTLWDGKLILVGFVVVSIAIFGLFLILSDTKYETKVKYEINLIPPFLGNGEITSDISQTFKSPNTFARWKKSRSSTSLGFDLIDEKRLVDGAYFAVPEKDQLVRLNNTHITIETDDTQLIFEVIDYFAFVGLALSESYAVEAKRERSRYSKLETELLSKLNSQDKIPTLESIVDLDRYIDKVSDGEHLIIVSRPAPPIKTSIANRVLLALAIMIGGSAGAVFLLVRRAYRARNLQKKALEA